MDSNSNVSVALVPAQREVTPSIWQMINDMAPVMYECRLFGVSSKAAAAAIMLKGYELGLGITASFEFIQVIEGKPTLAPRGALALLHTNPLIECIEVTRLVGENDAFLGYECFMRRKNGFEHTSRFTLAEAQQAGLVKPQSAWQKYPQNMCMWRAIGFCADVVAPDVTAGMTALMKMPEAFGVALTEGGDVIEGNFTPAPVTTSATATAANAVPMPPSSPAITLDLLLTKWTAEQILVAGEGKLPETEEELRAIEKKLGVHDG